MADLHVLVDFENVHPSPDEVSILVPGWTKLWVFYGSNQRELIKGFQRLEGSVTAVPIARGGRNSLDFHLAFYLGYLASKQPESRLVIVANDRGYEPVVAHAKILNLNVDRIGHKAAKAPTKSTKKPATVEKPSTTKKAAEYTKGTPANMSAATKQKVPAAKRQAAKKVAAKKTPAANSPTGSTAAATPAETPSWATLVSKLKALGRHRPKELQALEQMIPSVLGLNSDSRDIAKAHLSNLLASGVVESQHTGLLYNFSRVNRYR